MKNNKSKFLITTIHKNKFEKIKVVLDAFALCTKYYIFIHLNNF